MNRNRKIMRFFLVIVEKRGRCLWLLFDINELMEKDSFKKRIFRIRGTLSL